MNGRTWPVNLRFLRNFHIIEEVQGSRRLIPHTDQLLNIAQALQHEFEAGLTRKIRANPVWMAVGAALFCRFIRFFRCSHIWPYPIVRSPDFIANIGVVQHIIDMQPNGGVHSFRLFRNDAFLPEVHFSGQPLRVCSHVLDRYQLRLG